MATSNEQILDLLIRHQVDLLRFARGMRERLVRIINRAEPDLRAQLRARLERVLATGVDDPKRFRKRMSELRRALFEAQQEMWSEARSQALSDLTGLAQSESDFISNAVTSVAPVALALDSPTQAQLNALVRNFPIDGRPFADWFSRWRRGDLERMLEEVRTGVVFNETPTQVSRRVFGTRALGGTNGVREVTRRGALTFTQTAMSAISNEVRSQVLRENKLAERELYVATLDSRTTPICRSLDGDVFPIAEGPRPPLHPNCRSLRVPALDLSSHATRPSVPVTENDLRGLRGSARRRKVAQLVGQVPAKMNYEQWLRRQSAAFQDDVLGRTRGRLFRRGGLSLDRFVDETGRQFTLDELRERNSAAFARINQ